MNSNHSFLILIYALLLKLIDSNCVVSIGSTVDAYSFPSMVPRIDNSVIYDRELALYNCKDQGQYMLNYDGNNEDAPYFLGICLNGKMMSTANSSLFITENIDCDPVPNFDGCILDYTSSDIEIIPDYEPNNTIKNNHSLIAKCIGPGDWFPLQIKCQSGTINFFDAKNNNIGEAGAKDLCERAGSACDTEDARPLINLVNTTPRKILRDDTLASSCYETQTSLDIVCRNGGFVIRNIDNSELSLNVQNVVEICLSSGGGPSSCLIDIGNNVKVLSVPSREERAHETGVNLGDQLIYVCDTPNFVLDDVYNNGMQLNTVQIECTDSGLVGPDGPIKAGLDCVQAACRGFCLWSELPVMLQVDAGDESDAETFLQNAQLPAHCFGAEWYDLTVECTGTFWSVKDNGIDVTNSLSDVCYRAKRGCNLRNVALLGIDSGTLPEKIPHGQVVDIDCFGGGGNIRLVCDETELKLNNENLPNAIANFSNIAKHCEYAFPGPYQCTIEIGTGVKVYVAETGEERTNESHVHLGDHFVYTCDTQNYLLDNVFGDSTRLGHVEVVCTANGLTSYGRQVHAGLNCISAPAVICLTSDLPDQLNVPLPDKRVTGFVHGDVLEGFCGEADWHPIELECGNNLWDVSVNGAAVSNLLILCAQVTGGCPTSQIEQLAMFQNIAEYELDSSELTGTCFGSYNQIVFTCRNGRFQVHIDDQSSEDASFENVASLCGFNYAGSSQCTIEVGPGVHVYAIPSNEVRTNLTPVQFGDSFMYTCDQEDHVLSDVFSDGSTRGYIEVVCSFAGLIGSSRLVKPGVDCVHATPTTRCLSSALPSYLEYDKQENVNTFISGDFFGANCSGSGNWYNFSVRCNDGQWEFFKNGEVVSPTTAEETCNLARNSCAVSKAKQFAMFSEPAQGRILENTQISANCIDDEERDLQLRCVENEFEFKARNLTWRQVSFADIAAHCGFVYAEHSEIEAEPNNENVEANSVRIGLDEQ
ncbi:hypothetical protein MHBO_001767 [Bonamia ostreae]|uniref:Uncharacterized protein n=1 Tax=Bonamia ostreae TaxID=126728 RepID=A0ABV2AK34_9EUKA